MTKISKIEGSDFEFCEIIIDLNFYSWLKKGIDYEKIKNFFKSCKNNEIKQKIFDKLFEVDSKNFDFFRSLDFKMSDP